MKTTCPELIADLSSSKLAVRRRAINMLERRSMLPCLELALASSETSDGAKKLICEILYRMRWPEAVPALLEQLHAQSAEIRSIAADALGNIGDVRGGPALLQLLEDENQPTIVRDNAAFALGLVGYHAAWPVLVRYLHDPAESVRYCAAKSLSWLEEPAAIPGLEVALQVEKEERVRRQIEEALRNSRHRE